MLAILRAAVACAQPTGRQGDRDVEAELRRGRPVEDYAGFSLGSLELLMESASLDFYIEIG